MSDIEFFRTVMGQRFYEGTLPSLVRELARLNANLVRLNEALERRDAPAEGAAPVPAAQEEAP
jgi:hypothetical protein